MWGENRQMLIVVGQTPRAAADMACFSGGQVGLAIRYKGSLSCWGMDPMRRWHHCSSKPKLSAANVVFYGESEAAPPTHDVFGAVHVLLFRQRLPECGQRTRIEGCVPRLRRFQMS